MSKLLSSFNLKNILIIIILPFCCLLSLGEEVKIKSDFLSVNKNNKTSVFTKNVLIVIQNIKIKSDKAIVFFEKNVNTPSKVIVPNFLIIYDESSKNILSADSMNFDNKTKEILFYNVSGIYEKKFIKGKKLTVRLNKEKKEKNKKNKEK
jgi:lipopolysaccharide export system protein LptA